MANFNPLNTPNLSGTGAIMVRIGLSLKKSRFSETQVSLILHTISELFLIPPKPEEIRNLCLSLFSNNSKTGV